MDQIASIGNTVKEKTPDFIAKPLIAMANAIEAFRLSHASDTSFISAIFSEQILFYSLLFLAIFLILRFIWFKIL